jgi:hypothetical protein
VTHLGLLLKVVSSPHLVNFRSSKDPSLNDFSLAFESNRVMLCPQDLELEYGIDEVHVVDKYVNEEDLEITRVEPHENVQATTLHWPGY